MSASQRYKQVANVERRTWDKETYEARAKAREAAAGKKESLPDKSGGPRPPKTNDDDDDDEESEKEEFTPAVSGSLGPELSERAYLKSRTGRVDLDSKVGTSEMVAPEAAAATKSEDISITDGVTQSSSGVGWHCKVCDCFLKDSLTYLDHINGRKHQKTLGFTMRVEKSTPEEVRVKMAQLAKAGSLAEKENANGLLRQIRGDGIEEQETFEDVVREKDEEALRRKTERAKKREERKKRILQEQEEENEEEEGAMDPDMAAMMGFGGFGGGNKN